MGERGVGRGDRTVPRGRPAQQAYLDLLVEARARWEDSIGVHPVVTGDICRVETGPVVLDAFLSQLGRPGPSTGASDL